MTPEQLRELADRIDFDKQWSRPPETLVDDGPWTQEQRDRRDAGVNLRRYAHGKERNQEAQKPGSVYLRGYKLTRVDHSTDHAGCGDNAWHSAIGLFADSKEFPLEASSGDRGKARAWPRMMYAAKQLSDEVPRMILLFEYERKGLADSFKMCAHDPAPATPLPDNHLTCHLGVECRKCPYLAAIEAASMPNEAKDEAKAWTCATHILTERPDDYIEEYIYDKSSAIMNDRMARAAGGDE